MINKAINYYLDKGFKPISRRVGGYVVMGKSLRKTYHRFNALLC